MFLHQQQIGRSPITNTPRSRRKLEPTTGADNNGVSSFLYPITPERANNKTPKRYCLAATEAVLQGTSVSDVFIDENDENSENAGPAHNVLQNTGMRARRGVFTSAEKPPRCAKSQSTPKNRLHTPSREQTPQRVPVNPQHFAPIPRSNSASTNMRLQTPEQKDPERQTYNFSNTVSQSSTRKQKVVFKVLVMGNSKCGKTSFIQRYANNRFDPDYKITIGADYAKKVITTDTHQIRLQLWDIAGQDRFAYLTRPFYQRANAAVILCDVTRPPTLEAVRAWKSDLDLKLGGDEGMIPCVVVANKCDLFAGIPQAIQLGAQIEHLCSEMNVDKWFIASAKVNENIDQAMSFLLDALMRKEASKPTGAESAAAVVNPNVVTLDDLTKPIPKNNNCC